MSRELNPAQIWSQVPVANRTVGAAASVTGAVGSVTGAVGSVTTVSDKTGYSLTAGSYSVRASSTQQVAISVPSGQGTGNNAISSVTTTRAGISGSGARTASNDVTALAYANLTSSTNINYLRVATPSNLAEGAASVVELF